MPSPSEALAALKAGNKRFLNALDSGQFQPTKPDSADMSGAQKPFAVILGCSDSRAPAELIFDQGFGQLFVVRVAGNIAGPSQLGSVEFAVETFGTPLVVVMGHTHCGAVAATLNAIKNPDAQIPQNLLPIVEPIRPALKPLVAPGSDDENTLMTQAVEANVSNAVKELESNSSAIASRLKKDELKLVGAVYSLETGAVNFI